MIERTDAQSALHAYATEPQPERTEAMMRGSLKILTLYLLVTAVPLLRLTAMTGAWLPLMTHAALLAVTVLGLLSRGVPHGVRAWAPLALVPFLYVELRWVIAGAGFAHADATVATWDIRVFGSSVSRTLAMRWHWIALSEVLHLCYLAYYVIVYLPPALLWVERRYKAFAATVLALVVMYTICFAVFVLFPVDGPRFIVGPSGAPDGPIRSIVLRILEAGSSRGTSFPSAHIAASVVGGLCALRFQRRVGIAIMLLTVGMMLGAVYGGYHYGVDVLAGLVVGLAAAAIAYAAECVIERPARAPR